MVVCMAMKVRASILIGILWITLISWIPTSGNKATYFTGNSYIPGGEARYQYFLKVGSANSASLGITDR